MDRRLQESVTRGDVPSLKKLMEYHQDMFKQKVPGSDNTILHLAARFGHVEYAREVVKRWPEMVSLENAELETPLHEACREGHLEIAQLLLETDPWVAYRVNSRGESVLFASCERGNIDVVKHLLQFPRLLMLELDMETTSLHVAVSSGNTEIVKEILKIRPDFAWKKKHQQGWTALHVACSKGNLEITRELVKLDSDLCSIQDAEGRIPLHCAATKGRINIIDEILSNSLEFSETTTYGGETILHLAVKNNQYEAVKYLTESLNTVKVLNMQDNDGNTILHLATAGKLTEMVIYLLKIGVEVNCLNRKGFTALDVVEADATNSSALTIVPALQQAGAKRCDQLSPGFIDIHTNLSECLHNRIPDNQYTTNRRRNRHRAKKLDLQNEGLRNARKTVTIVAVLIATVTFAAGINPPGGFHEQTGKAIRGNFGAFKVFMGCNIVALFLSLGVVNVLVSIIPFTRGTMMNLLSTTHKLTWLSTLFMTAGYIAGVWTIMPDGRGGHWVSVELVVIGGGCSVVVFLGLGFLLVRHWKNKFRWRRERRKRIKDDSPNGVEEMKTMKKTSYDSSSNSDVDSSDHGYHLY